MGEESPGSVRRTVSVLSNKLRSTVAVVSCAMVVACGYPKEAGEKLANETYALSTQLQALQKAMREQQQLTERQAELIDEMKTEVDGLSRAARRNDADLGVQVDNVLQQMGQLRGLVEGTKERADEIEQKVNRLEEAAKIAGAASEEDKTRAIEEAKAREQILANPELVINESIALVNQQKAEDARSLLREFLLRAKENKAFDRWKADAQYLVGETFYAEGDYKRAATEYNTVRKKYPDASKVPDALLKMGMCFEQLNLPDDAKLFYQTVKKQYPKSGAAKEATARLKKLRT